jgi:hypothetical protein
LTTKPEAPNGPPPGAVVHRARAAVRAALFDVDDALSPRAG